ncbi:Metal-dependent hydrolase, endonuclease/exonuclease/phosphatase family [Oribacterium sp. KHPX15]|uniref:endonuclease/exonuclease/phosphatase family protein n=1 Tax=Oribacterium sp. KHPX15 TaxID=1855342 RepID=UPI00089CD22F|nr:endonuclease/exonuclease/phosphatase family protein [Oribacterium sp. KHPX15]SEA90749.1 Metal-dependent hydrolase, endonuclease/exonuclease/phosphatase family [Oribacterium sp. KHPX15]
MKIATWNVNMGAALPWYDKKELKKEVVDIIIKVDADIFIINEIALATGWDYFEEKIKEKNYVWFSSFVSGKNGLLVLIKEELIGNTKKLAESLWWHNALYSNNNLGLIKVSFELKSGKTCSVCGFRMLIGDKKGKAAYDHMRFILDDQVLPIATECFTNNDVVIFAGDFNNASYRDDYTGKDHINYNWQIIKSGFEGIGYEMLDVNSENGPIITKKDCTSGTPIDHIFAKGLHKISINPGKKP